MDCTARLKCDASFGSTAVILAAIRQAAGSGQKQRRFFDTESGLTTEHL